MDPNMTLRLLLQAMANNDREATYERLEDLQGWIISRNGALPVEEARIAEAARDLMQAADDLAIAAKSGVGEVKVSPVAWRNLGEQLNRMRGIA